MVLKKLSEDLPKPKAKPKAKKPSKPKKKRHVNQTKSVLPSIRTGVMGRPTVYSDEICRQAWLYLEDYAKHGHVIPSIVGLADVLKVAESTIYEWSKKHVEDFSGILPAIKGRQQMVLLNKGLDGTFNAMITKLVLGKHGYHERQETELSGKDGGAIQISRIELVPMAAK
jgi:hypothetical protein